MFNFYSFKPIDTLFFKGAEPMVMGESHSSNLIFPPPAHTIEGAIRTKLYKLDKEKYKDLIKIGEEKPGFDLIGPFFIKQNKLYVPTPYLWFKDKETEKLIKAKQIETEIIKMEFNNLYWAKGDKGEIESLGGTWIKYDDLVNNIEQPEIIEINDLVEKEIRTGIALEKNRRVRKGHIYSFTHVRLKEGIDIAFAVDIELPFDEQSVLMLGAEQRFGKLNKINVTVNFKKEGDLFLNLSVISSNEINKENVIATGKPLSFGGWDLSKGFHKPMKIYYPAGSVFNKKINNNFIAL
jgi:CRISPR-associated protein Cmr3